MVVRPRPVNLNHVITIQPPTSGSLDYTIRPLYIHECFMNTFVYLGHRDLYIRTHIIQPLPTYKSFNLSNLMPSNNL